VPHGELTGKKWLDSIEKQKRRSDLKEQRDRQTDRVNDKKIIDSYSRAVATVEATEANASVKFWPR